MKQVPVEIELERGSRLLIRWSDGESSEVPLVRLRQACPCAACREARAQAQSAALPVASPPSVQVTMAVVDDVELVGRYGLRIIWADGHAAGIFGFDRLRDLAE